MIECKNCGIKIKDKTKVCPMCDMVLSGDDKHNENTYPDVRQKTKILRRIVNIFSYFAIVLEIVFIVINYVKWSAISGGAIVYVICMLHFIINDHYGHIKKMYVGFIGALFYIMLVDFVLGYKGWSLGVGMPVIVLTLDAIIIVCMIINRQICFFRYFVLYSVQFRWHFILQRYFKALSFRGQVFWYRLFYLPQAWLLETERQEMN